MLVCYVWMFAYALLKIAYSVTNLLTLLWIVDSWMKGVVLKYDAIIYVVDTIIKKIHIPAVYD